MAKRAPIAERAGTHIDHKFAEKIFYHEKNHGIIDPTQRVYQHGGEARTFIFWKMKAISFPYDVWVQVAPQVDSIEMIDHVRNEVYVCQARLAASLGQRYRDEKLGFRYAIPLHLWKVLDANGEITRDHAG